MEPVRMPPKTLSKNRNKTRLLLDEHSDGNPESPNSSLSSPKAASHTETNGSTSVKFAAKESAVDSKRALPPWHEFRSRNITPIGNWNVNQQKVQFADGDSADKPRAGPKQRAKTQMDLKAGQPIFIPAGSNFVNILELKGPGRGAIRGPGSVENRANHGKRVSARAPPVCRRQEIDEDSWDDSWDVKPAPRPAAPKTTTNRTVAAVRAKLAEHKRKSSTSSSTTSKESSEVNEDLHSPCTCEDFGQCKYWLRRNTAFEKKTADGKAKKGWPLLKTKANPGCEEQLDELLSETLVLHGAVIVRPQNTSHHLGFDARIQQSMHTLGLKQAVMMQRYVWPSLQRRLNFFMVGAANTGKTIAYLPSMCTFALEKHGYYGELAGYAGPLVMVLCHSDKCCQDVYERFGDLLAGFDADDGDKPTVQLLNGSSNDVTNSDIVITKPSVLNALLKSEQISLKRLCHLVLEEASFLLKTDALTVANFLRILNQVQLNRPHNKSVQIIASCERWSVNMDRLWRRIYITPVVCFDNCFNAALYSKVAFEWKRIDTNYRQYRALDILSNNFKSHNTILFAEDDQLSELYDFYTMKGIEVIKISNDMSKGEISENENTWCSLKCGNYKALLISDVAFERTHKIQKAEWIINFSAPINKAAFLERFKSLLQNLHAPTEDSDQKVEMRALFMDLDDEVTQKFQVAYLDNLIALFNL